MGFDRMSIPLLRSLSGSVIGSSERRRSKSRSRRLDTSSTTTPTPAESSQQSQPPTPGEPVTLIPPVPPIPSICIRHAPEPAMVRKIWVKRPGASATRVDVNEEDLVDNVRDAILQKYRNSLGRSIDSPDITLTIVSRDSTNNNAASERALGPEEEIGRILDRYYPGGQKIEEALIIEVPKARTPKPSPRSGNHQIQYFVPEQYRPDDVAREYFPPMPLQSPHGSHPPGPHGHSMAVLTTGQLPPLPSPGGHASRRHNRPKYGRQHTSSPTILHSSQPNGAILGTDFNLLPDSS
jgi:hypothetical protein